MKINHTGKKILSILMAWVLCVGCVGLFPITVGAYSYTDILTDDPAGNAVVVSTWEELVNAVENDVTVEKIYLNSDFVINYGSCFVPNHDVIIDGFYNGVTHTVTNQGSDSAFNLTGAQSVTFQNIVFNDDTTTSSTVPLLQVTNASSKLTLKNCTVTGAHAGGIKNQGILVAENCLFLNNKSSNAGGAICSNKTAVLINCDFYGNEANSLGGAVQNALGGSMVIDGCSFIENKSTNSGQAGGAIDTRGTALYMNNTVIANNYAANYGGAMYVYSGAVYMMNSTIVGNAHNNTSNCAVAVNSKNSETREIVNCFMDDNFNSVNASPKESNYTSTTPINCIYNSTSSQGDYTENETTAISKGSTAGNTQDFSHPILVTASRNEYAKYVPVKNVDGIHNGVDTYFDYSLDGSTLTVKMGYGSVDNITYMVGSGLTAADKVTTYFEGGTRTSGIIGASGVEAPIGLTLTYNGEAQALGNSNGIAGVTWSEAVDGDFISTIPTKVNAGTYTIYYKIDDGEPVEVTATIQPKELTVSGIAAEDKDYDGNTEATLIYDSVTFAGLEDCDSNTAEQPDNITVTATGTFDNENVGTDKTVTISNLTLGGTSASNYTLAEDGQQDTATATITPAALTEVSVVQSSDLIYNGNALVPAVTASATAVNDQEVTFTYSATEDGTYTTAVPSVTDAGTYTCYYKATAPNHSEAAGSFTVTVIYPAAEVTTAPTKVDGLIYDGTEQTLINNDGVVSGGTLMYAVGNDDETAPEDGYDVELPGGTNAGSYYIWYKVVGDDTHSDSLPVCITTVIGQADITEAGITVSGYQGDYDGAAHGIRVTAEDEASTTVYYSTEQALTDTDYDTAGVLENPTRTDAGSTTVYYYVANHGNYTDVVTGSADIVINKINGTATADMTEAQKPAAKTGLEYNEKAQALLTAPEELAAGYAKVQYSLDGGHTWTDTIPTGTSVGDYTVYVKYVGDRNHNDLIGGTITVSIAEPKYIILDGKDQTLPLEQGKELTIRASGSVEDFAGLKIDGVEVDRANYTVTSGSTIITLKPEFLDTLGEGEHTFTFVYVDGEVSTSFTLTQAVPTAENADPQTTDHESAAEAPAQENNAADNAAADTAADSSSTASTASSTTEQSTTAADNSISDSQKAAVKTDNKAAVNKAVTPETRDRAPVIPVTIMMILSGIMLVYMARKWQDIL